MVVFEARWPLPLLRSTGLHLAVTLYNLSVSAAISAYMPIRYVDIATRQKSKMTTGTVCEWMWIRWRLRLAECILFFGSDSAMLYEVNSPAVVLRFSCDF